MASKKREPLSKLCNLHNVMILLTGPVTQATGETYVYHEDARNGLAFTDALLSSWGAPRWRVWTLDNQENAKEREARRRVEMKPYPLWCFDELGTL